MRLCSFYNLTLILGSSFVPSAETISGSGTTSVNHDDYIENNKLAKYLMNRIFLGQYDDAKKYCKFIYAESMGTYFPNNKTYSYALNLVSQMKEAMIFKPLDYYTEIDDSLKFTTPLGSIHFTPMQIIDKEKALIKGHTFSELLDYLTPSLSFMIFLFASIIFYLLSLFAIMKMNNLNSKNLAIKILSFSFVLFLFIMGNLYNSNLSTEDVIVDTSQILDSLDKILNTNKELCIQEKSAEFDYFIKATNKESIAYRVYSKLNKTHPCLIYNNGQFANDILKKNLKNVFLLNYDLASYLSSRFANTFAREDTYLSSISIYESVRSFIINGKMKKEIRIYLDKCIYFISTYGFMKEFTSSLKFSFPKLTVLKFAKIGGKDGFMGYTSTADYIEDFTYTVPLSFDKFESFFQIYFGFLILILAVYLIHHLAVFIFNCFFSYKSLLLQLINSDKLYHK